MDNNNNLYGQGEDNSKNKNETLLYFQTCCKYEGDKCISKN